MRYVLLTETGVNPPALDVFSTRTEAHYQACRYAAQRRETIYICSEDTLTEYATVYPGT